MKKLTWILTVPLIMAAASPALFAQDKDPEAKKKQIRNGAVIAIGSGAGAYLTREKPLYKDALHAMPMDEGKEQRILKVADELLKDADTSHIPNEGLLNKARIKMKEMKRPIVAITKETSDHAPRFRAANVAAEVAEDIPVKPSLVKRLAALLRLNGSTKTEMDVINHGGKEHLVQQLAGLKDSKHILVTEASVHSASRKLANKTLKFGAVAGVAYAAGTTGYDLLNLRLTDAEIKSCNENGDGSVICEKSNLEKRPPAIRHDKGDNEKKDSDNAK